MLKGGQGGEGEGTVRGFGGGGGMGGKVGDGEPLTLPTKAPHTPASPTATTTTSTSSVNGTTATEPTILSPDSAIVVTPTSPTTPTPTTPAAVDSTTNDGDKNGREDSIEKTKSEETTSSEEGYEEDDEGGMEEEELTEEEEEEEEVVLSASMQFPLGKAAAPPPLPPDTPTITTTTTTDPLEGGVEGGDGGLGMGGQGVTVRIDTEALLKEASPSGCESDIEDNDEEEEEEEEEEDIKQQQQQQQQQQHTPNLTAITLPLTSSPTASSPAPPQDSPTVTPSIQKPTTPSQPLTPPQEVPSSAPTTQEPTQPLAPPQEAPSSAPATQEPTQPLTLPQEVPSSAPATQEPTQSSAPPQETPSSAPSPQSPALPQETPISATSIQKPTQSSAPPQEAPSSAPAIQKPTQAPAPAQESPISTPVSAPDTENTTESPAPPQESPSPTPKAEGGVDGVGEVVHLPDTVTRLDTPEGAAVYLVGTAHFSRESQEDVANTIRTVKPDVVVVELCKARTAILQLDEDTILQESRTLDLKKVQMIMRQHGKIQGVLYLLLLSVSAHITKQLGMAPGGEFRMAFAEARRSAPGCLIQLGDRPIQITLSRALASLSLWHKVKLTWHILTSKEPISKEEVERCKQRDFILEMLAEMTGQFPAISEVFVKERDLYLCRSLQAAAHTPPGLAPRVVVGVVGIGHVPGIVEHWGTVTDKDIAPIMRIPPPTLSSRIIKTSIKASFYTLLCYGVYRWLLPRPAQSALTSALSSTLATASSSAHSALQSVAPSSSSSVVSYFSSLFRK